MSEPSFRYRLRLLLTLLSHSKSRGLVEGELGSRPSSENCSDRDLPPLLQGLNAKEFWEHSAKILSASRESVDAVIAELLDSEPPSLAGLSLASTTATTIRNTHITLEFTTTSRPSPSSSTSHVVIEAAKGPISPAAPPANPESTIVLAARTGKSGYHPFFNSLDPVVEFATKKLGAGETVGVEVAQSEAQSEANDLGAAFVLVLLGEFSRESYVRPS